MSTKLQQAYTMAIELGIPEDQLDEMFDAAKKLGDAIGYDTLKEALDEWP